MKSQNIFGLLTVLMDVTGILIFGLTEQKNNLYIVYNVF